LDGLQNKLNELETQADKRRHKLMDNSAFLQFNWKANVVESWIGKDTLLQIKIHPSGKNRRKSSL